jgi:hypothetical protein
MKKTLIMLLVLGMAGTASAAIVDYTLQYGNPDGPGTSPDNPLQESDTIALDIHWTDVTQSGALLQGTGGLLLSIEGAGTFVDQPIDAYTKPQWFTPGYPSNGTFNVYYGFHPQQSTDPPTELDPQLLAIEGATSIQLPTNYWLPSSTIVVDHILVHCEGDGNVIVTLTPITWDAVIAPPNVLYEGTLQSDREAYGSEIIIYQVPEPLTVALLGLGGLALVRRRRA